MDLLPTGYKGDLIFIETEVFKLHIKGKQGNKKSDAISANLNIEAALKVDYDCTDKISIKTLTSTGELANNSGYTMMPCFYEEGIYEMLLINKGNNPLAIYHDSSEIKNSFTSAENIIFGSFSFGGEIGYSTFQIISGSRAILTLTIEVFPAKMDYRTDYINMINDVNDEIASLAFEFMGKTQQSAMLADTTNQTAAEFYNILKKVFEKFSDALIRIERFPKHKVVSSEKIQLADKAKNVSKNTEVYMRKHPEILYKHDKGINISGTRYMPQYVLEVMKETTTDIHENRFVKYIIKTILKRIRVIKQRIAKSYSEDSPYYKELCKFDKGLSAHLNRFFSNVGELQDRKSMSLVFQMAPGYREVYYYYMLLKKGLALSDELYTITPKKIWKLYEIWCYIKLHNILRKLGYEVVHYGIIKAVDQGLYLTLIQDDTATMEYRNGEGDLLELCYNHTYSDKQTTTTEQRPDTVLSIRRKGREENRIYIFDAKYRFNVEKDGTIGPMEDDINVMHRYRDSIVSRLDDSLQFKYDTFGAYVMFPYADEEKYRSHRFYKSIDTVNIGALPMLPGSTKLMEDYLVSLLGQSAVQADLKLITHGKYDDYARFKQQNVMVANVKDAEHLRVYVENKFFHIPSKTLAHVRPGIEYIAFYCGKGTFSSSSEKDKHDVIIPGVCYYGRVKCYKVYLRDECTELPKKSKESYIRFELEDIKPVGPIATVEYGVRNVMYTTLYLLENAENIHELKLKSREEIELYKRLKEIARARDERLIRYVDYYMLGDVRVEMMEDKRINVKGKTYSFRDGMDNLVVHQS